MSIFIAIVSLSSVYVAQNKQIGDDYKVGFFAVIGVVTVLALIMNLLGGA